MHKPVKPKKKVIMERSATFSEWDYKQSSSTKQIPLKAFLAWCKSQVPSKAKDVILKIDEYWEYDNCIVNLELNWKQTLPNLYYDSDLKKYQKKLTKWKKTCQK